MRRLTAYYLYPSAAGQLAETERVDWNKRNRSGQTPLYWALISVRQTQTEIVNIIVSQPNIDYTVRQGRVSTPEIKSKIKYGSSSTRVDISVNYGASCF